MVDGLSRWGGATPQRLLFFHGNRACALAFSCRRLCDREGPPGGVFEVPLGFARSTGSLGRIRGWPSAVFFLALSCRNKSQCCWAGVKAAQAPSASEAWP